MTTETRSAQNTSRPTSSADAHPTRGKPGGAGNPGPGAPGGFMAILASLDTSGIAVAATPGPTDPALQAYAAGANALVATDGTCGDLKPALRGVPDGLRGLVTDGDATSVLDPAAALDDAIGKLLQDVPSDVSATHLPIPTDAAAAVMPVATELPPQTSALLAQSLQWSSAPASSSEPARVGQLSGFAPGMGSGVRSAVPVESTPVAQVLGDWDGQSAKESIARAGRLQRDAAERLASVNAALAAPVDAVGQTESRASAFLSTKSMDPPLTPMATALAMANTLAPMRREESTRERSVFRTTVPEGGVMAQTYAPTSVGAQTPGAVQPATPTDMYVAEKVAYWISNDVQNAEMKLEGIGVEPVEVSIRMQGNEAHIAFRTDEVLARSALESASAHLKDLLQREGLLLSGVSVGTSGSGNPGDSERRPRQGMRQSAVVSLQPAGGDSISGASRATRGALDLFV